MLKKQIFIENKNQLMDMEKKIYDSDLLIKSIEKIDESTMNKDGEYARYNGVYYEYNDLDVQHLENPIFKN